MRKDIVKGGPTNTRTGDLATLNGITVHNCMKV